MGPDSAQSTVPAASARRVPAAPSEGPRVPEGRRVRQEGLSRDERLVPPSRWATVLAFAMVVVPFAVILIRLGVASGQHLYLPDDLALIDLHTRRALQWKQQLGVFDHNGWNHPGPTYFYLLSVVYRVLGSGARAMFFGATLLNALGAVACVAVVRRRATPFRALWAATWVCVLASLLAVFGPGSVTFSEGALGGLVSPWNPMVVIFPLLLLVLLCAAAIDRSILSLLGAVLVGSFIVQTNVSALVLVVSLLAVTTLAVVVTASADHRRRMPATPDQGGPSGRRSWSVARWPWLVAAAVVFVLMWLPPAIQQLTNHPGNFTLIERFFTAANQGPTLGESLWSVVSVIGVLARGPSEVMSSYLGHASHHAGEAVAVTVLIVLVGVATTVIGIRQRRRFAAALGALGLLGMAAMVVAVTHVVGDVYGYLVVWAVALPIAVLIGAGMVLPPGPSLPEGGTAHRRRRVSPTASPGLRVAACLVGVVAAAVLCARVVSIPPLSTVSDPEVGRLAALVTPVLHPRGSVFVNDSGAGSDPGHELLDVEQFIGLVNQLDQRGFHPRVNHLWRAEFGPGFEATGAESDSVELRTWMPSSPDMAGYRGRVGDLAVTVIPSRDGRSLDPADSPG